MASEVNSTMSNMKVDSITILKNAVCIYPVILNYNYDLTISASKVDMDFASMKKINTQTWCTDPDLRFALDRLTGVAYTYRDKNGAYVGKYEIKKSECLLIDLLDVSFKEKRIDNQRRNEVHSYVLSSFRSRTQLSVRI
ncbi:MAG: hypothetical protein NZ811_08935 [Gammaproteobacteria bacterium]|nr:hypothetical protein [Gammaproteobacteria bacterium]